MLHRFQQRADSRRMSPEYRRLTPALLLSLLIHTLMLSLTFGLQGRWLPGFGFPWQDRRIEVPDLRVVVLPAQVTPAEPAVTPLVEPLQQARGERSGASGSVLTPSASRAPTPPRTAAEIVSEANPGTDVATGAAPAQTPLLADRPGDMAPPPIPAPAVIALARTDEATWVVPTPATPSPIEAAPSAASPETGMPSLRDAGDAARARDEELARQQAAELQAATRLVVARQEAARLEAARSEAERQEAARVAVAKVDAAAKIEAAKIEAAKIEAAKIEAAKIEAAKIEAAKIEAAKIEAGKREAAKGEAARGEVAQEAAARREATLRAIGRQLDEEAARREAATAAARQSPSTSKARRYRLFGRTDPNEELILYAEAWARKIHLNMTFDMVREAAKQPHTDPLVTVAIRSDGSVESVTFVRSSGVAALDEAIRRVVYSQTPYQVFPPGLAREFDVIEIRRTWYFDIAIRLY